MGNANIAVENDDANAEFLKGHRNRVMQSIYIDTQNGKVAVVNSDEVIIADGRSAMDFAVSIGYENSCQNFALNKAAITEDFFDLSTGLAGEIVQKFVNFGYRLAIFGDFSQYTSKSLRDFIYESNKGRYLYFADSQQAAIEELGRIK